MLHHKYEHSSSVLPRNVYDDVKPIISDEAQQQQLQQQQQQNNSLIE